MARAVHATLLCLRRGPLDAAWHPRVLGQSNPPLAPGTQSLEERVARRLAAFQPERVLSSDLARARSTAELVAAQCGASLAVRRDLREQRLGKWQGQLWSELLARDPAALAFLKDCTRVEPPGGETLEAVQVRVVRATLAECRRRPRKSLCYVGHAGPIRCLISHALGIPVEKLLRLQLDPFGLTVLALQGTTATLVSLNRPLDAELDDAVETST